MNKIQTRQRRRTRTRNQIARIGAVRLCVHRTPQHIYAQIIDPTGARVLASASTLETELRSSLKTAGNITAASAVGKRIAEKAKQAALPRWHSIALASSITVASRRLPMRRVKTAWNSEGVTRG